MLLNRSPLGQRPKSLTPLDLHTLGTPLAFVLSQDQTLHQIWIPIGTSSLSLCRDRSLRIEKRVHASAEPKPRETREPSRSKRFAFVPLFSFQGSPHATDAQKPPRPGRYPERAGTTPLGFPRARRVSSCGASVSAILSNTDRFVKGLCEDFFLNPAGSRYSLSSAGIRFRRRGRLYSKVRAVKGVSAKISKFFSDALGRGSGELITRYERQVVALCRRYLTGPPGATRLSMNTTWPRTASSAPSTGCIAMKTARRTLGLRRVDPDDAVLEGHWADEVAHLR